VGMVTRKSTECDWREVLLLNWKVNLSKKKKEKHVKGESGRQQKKKPCWGCAKKEKQGRQGGKRKWKPASYWKRVR